MHLCHPRRIAWTLAFWAALCGAASGADDGPGTPAAPGAGSARATPGGPARPDQGGLASITRDRLEGFKTASGEPYSRNAMTAAHRTLPFGTLVRVTNLDNRRTVIVRINDRAAAVGSHLIDLTPRAAAAIGLQGIGTVPVRLEVIGAGAVRLPPPPADPAVK